jgi:hypothetical protein
MAVGDAGYADGAAQAVGAVVAVPVRVFGLWRTAYCCAEAGPHGVTRQLAPAEP